MNRLLRLASKLEEGYALMYKDEAAKALRDAGELLRRIRSSIHTSGGITVLCMQDIDEILKDDG